MNPIGSLELKHFYEASFFDIPFLNIRDEEKKLIGSLFFKRYFNYN